MKTGDRVTVAVPAHRAPEFNRAVLAVMQGRTGTIERSRPLTEWESKDRGPMAYLVRFDESFRNPSWSTGGDITHQWFDSGELKLEGGMDAPSRALEITP